MTAEFNPVPVIIAGLIGAAVIVGVIYFIAVRWKRRSGIPYCLSACMFYGLLYVATFQYGILNFKSFTLLLTADRTSAENRIKAANGSSAAA